MKQYEKPVMRDLSNLTPALGLCSSGNADGGCKPTGSLAGGSQACQNGYDAVASDHTPCSTGSSIYPNTNPCTTGSNHHNA